MLCGAENMPKPCQCTSTSVWQATKACCSRSAGGTAGQEVVSNTVCTAAQACSSLQEKCHHPPRALRQVATGVLLLKHAAVTTETSSNLAG